jgi:hypothetical protein
MKRKKNKVIACTKKSTKLGEMRKERKKKSRILIQTSMRMSTKLTDC